MVWSWRCKLMDTPGQQVELINVGQIKRVNRRSKKALIEVIRNDTDAKGLNENILFNINE